MKDYKTFLRDLWGNLEKLDNDLNVNNTVDKMYKFETCVANKVSANLEMDEHFLGNNDTFFSVVFLLTVSK